MTWGYGWKESLQTNPKKRPKETYLYSKRDHLILHKSAHQGNLNRHPSYNLRLWLERVTSDSPFAGIEHRVHEQAHFVFWFLCRTTLFVCTWGCVCRRVFLVSVRVEKCFWFLCRTAQKPCSSTQKPKTFSYKHNPKYTRTKKDLV